MSLQSWLGGGSPRTPVKRKADSEALDSTPKKFSKVMSQNSYEWYVTDNSGVWHCKLCRDSKFSNQYATGHQQRAKTTNHARHAKSKYIIIYHLFQNKNLRRFSAI